MARASGHAVDREWSHINVFYWFDKNDVPQKRRILRVHPRGDQRNPLAGVFACRAPVRPNLIALSVCRIVSVKGNLVNVDQIDAFDATPKPLPAPTSSRSSFLPIVSEPGQATPLNLPATAERPNTKG